MIKDNLSMWLLKRPTPPHVNWAVARDFDLRDRVQALIDAEPSRAAAANKLGVARSLITEWLSGKRKLTLRTLSKIEEAYGVQLWGVVEDSVINSAAADYTPRDSKETRG